MRLADLHHLEPHLDLVEAPEVGEAGRREINSGHGASVKESFSHKGEWTATASRRSRTSRRRSSCAKSRGGGLCSRTPSARPETPHPVCGQPARRQARDHRLRAHHLALSRAHRLRRRRYRALRCSLLYPLLPYSSMLLASFPWSRVTAALRPGRSVWTGLGLTQPPLVTPAYRTARPSRSSRT